MQQVIDYAKTVWNFIIPKPETKVVTNVGESLRLVVQSEEFKAKLKKASPVLVTAVLVWPVFWIYRGFEWHNARGKETLPAYIQKTFYRAKFLELLILSTGILASLSAINTNNSRTNARNTGKSSF